MDSNIGKKLDGRYELLELIGVGGMADIYRARDLREDRIVAVKILKTEFAGSEEFLRRFRNESKAIALLSHPNIVKIYDVGFTDKVQFIVMEYVDGITLADYIEQQGVLKWRDAVHFTVQVLKALQHAHDRGIVHRDIKSSNIMLLRDGTIKVMDFGIARFNRENNKTVSEKTIGSVHYISPEQARGDITDERSDIYSVGVALYEMLTGKKPFDGDTPVAIALKHMQSEPRKPSEINETIPEGLEQIVLKAMQKDPQSRYQTAGEMISDLEEFKKNPGIVFDYKYNSTDGTNKFAAGTNPAAEQERTARKAAIENDDSYDEDNDDYDDDDVEYEERRSPLIPILFAVGAAFVIATVFLVLSLVNNALGSGNTSSGTSDLTISVDQDNNFNMPNLLGMTWEEVSKNEEYSKLMTLVPQQEWSEVTEGEIFDQEFPESRKVKVGSTVTVKVSKGIKHVEIQDFTNRTADDAERQLKRDGFKITTTFEENEDIPKDRVIRTIPAAHETAPQNSTVILVISLGPSDTRVSVPKLTGLPLSEAMTRCDEYNLTYQVEYENSEKEKGEVIKQSIDPLTFVDPNTEILLTVSTGEIPEQTKTINITLPKEITGEFEFKYYVDGVLTGSETRDVSLSGSKTIAFDITGKNGETKNFAIKVVSTANGNEGTYLEYEIVFEDDKATETELFKNSEIFSELNSSEPSPEPEPEPDSSEDNSGENPPEFSDSEPVSETDE